MHPYETQMSAKLAISKTSVLINEKNTPESNIAVNNPNEASLCGDPTVSMDIWVLNDEFVSGGLSLSKFIHGGHIRFSIHVYVCFGLCSRASGRWFMFAGSFSIRCSVFPFFSVFLLKFRQYPPWSVFNIGVIFNAVVFGVKLHHT